MSRFATLIKQLAQTLIVFLATVALVASSVLLVSAPQASAKTLTPEASSYEVEGADYSAEIRTNSNNSPVGSTDLNRDIQQNLKNATDNIQEKLNRDEPIYPGNKELISDVKNQVGDAVEDTQNAIENTLNRVTGK